MPKIPLGSEIEVAKQLVGELRTHWPRKTNRPADKKVDILIDNIYDLMMGQGYPKKAKDVQNLRSSVHANELIHPDDETSEYWVGVLGGLKYVDQQPPGMARYLNYVPTAPQKQNPLQYLNWSGQQAAFRWRLKVYKKRIKQRCDVCGHIGNYYYPRIGQNNSPEYLEDGQGGKVRDEKGRYIPTNQRYVMLRMAWERAEVKNVCSKCWDNGRGVLVPCPVTWVQETCFGIGQDLQDQSINIEDISVYHPIIEDQIIFDNIVEKFIVDKWVKLGSREHELLTVLFKCPDPEIRKHYNPADNDPPVPATMIVEDAEWGPIVTMCMFCEEICKNDIIRPGKKCKNYQAKIANYYGTTQTCVNQYRKRIIRKFQDFCSVHDITFTLPE